MPQPYLLFLGDTTEPGYAKTAFGLRDWARERCVGEFALRGATVSTGLPFLTPAQAAPQGARAMVIGVANAGGVIPASWIPALVQAMEAGLDMVSGMHVRLGDIAAAEQAAARLGRRLIDVRQPPAGIPVATGRPRSGQRLLTVGTDCALGKKYTALALARAFTRARRRCRFPRDRTDRHPDRRQRHSDGRGGGRLRRRCGRNAVARCAPSITGM